LVELQQEWWVPHTVGKTALQGWLHHLLYLPLFLLVLVLVQGMLVRAVGLAGQLSGAGRLGAAAAAAAGCAEGNLSPVRRHLIHS
jgi:hypothetical protein